MVKLIAKRLTLKRHKYKIGLKDRMLYMLHIYTHTHTHTRMLYPPTCCILHTQQSESDEFDKFEYLLAAFFKELFP